MEIYRKILLDSLRISLLQKAFLEKGGKINDSEAVLDIIPGSTTRVRTSKASYTCERLIITAGPWAPKLLKPIGINIPLQVYIQFLMQLFCCLCYALQLDSFSLNFT